MLTYNKMLTTLKDPAIQTRWQVIMPNQAQPFEIIVESAELIFRGVGARARRGQAKIKYYPEESDIQPLNLVMYETHDWAVTKYLIKWRERIRKEDGAYGVPSDYEETIVVQLLALDSDRVVQTFEYTGAWPIDPNPISLSYEDPNGRVQISASFRVDEVKIT